MFYCAAVAPKSVFVSHTNLSIHPAIIPEFNHFPEKLITPEYLEIDFFHTFVESMHHVDRMIYQSVLRSENLFLHFHSQLHFTTTLLFVARVYCTTSSMISCHKQSASLCMIVPSAPTAGPAVVGAMLDLGLLLLLLLPQLLLVPRNTSLLHDKLQRWSYLSRLDRVDSSLQEPKPPPSPHPVLYPPQPRSRPIASPRPPRTTN